MITEGRGFIDDAREYGFKNINLCRLLMTGSALTEEQQFKTVIARRYGTEEPLKSDGIPTVVLCASRNDTKVDLSKTGISYKPFILRTYDYPEQGDADTFHDNPTVSDAGVGVNLVEGTCSIKLCEAMAATSAVPGVVDRVRINVDGKQMSLADGMLYCNCPLVIAINEARRLYPNRPLGVIFSIGYGHAETEFVNRAVEVARLTSPDLHVQRIIPGEILADFSPLETDLKKIAIMEEQVRQYVRERVNLDVTLDKLFASNRGQKKETVARKSVVNAHHQSMLENKDFVKRTLERQSVRMRMSTYVGPISAGSISNNQSMTRWMGSSWLGPSSGNSTPITATNKSNAIEEKKSFFDFLCCVKRQRKSFEEHAVVEAPEARRDEMGLPTKKTVRFGPPAFVSNMDDDGSSQSSESFM